MGKLTIDQRNKLREFLVHQGLSFKPLQDEMTDHISCDLEERMAEGYSFEDAWSQSIAELPENHFKHLQKDIMETINKRFTLSQSFSFLALGLLIISTLFKVFHLQFADEVLLLSFGFVAASLLTTTLTGIFLNKEKGGATRVLAVIFGAIILLFGYSFKILHLRGADTLILLAVASLIISLLVNSVYVYKHASGTGNILTYLLEKYTPGIERFFLFLLIPFVIYKAISIILQTDDVVRNIVLLVVIFGAGLQLIALCWRMMEKDLSKRNAVTLAAIIISCLCLTLPFLGPILSIEVRLVTIILFSLVSGWLAYRMEEEPKKLAEFILAVLVPVLFLGSVALKAEHYSCFIELDFL